MQGKAAPGRGPGQQGKAPPAPAKSGAPTPPSAPPKRPGVSNPAPPPKEAKPETTAVKESSIQSLPPKPVANPDTRPPNNAYGGFTTGSYSTTRLGFPTRVPTIPLPGAPAQCVETAARVGCVLIDAAMHTMGAEGLPPRVAELLGAWIAAIPDPLANHFTELAVDLVIQEEEGREAKRTASVDQFQELALTLGTVAERFTPFLAPVWADLLDSFQKFVAAALEEVIKAAYLARVQAGTSGSRRQNIRDAAANRDGGGPRNAAELPVGKESATAAAIEAARLQRRIEKMGPPSEEVQRILAAKKAQTEAAPQPGGKEEPSQSAPAVRGEEPAPGSPARVKVEKAESEGTGSEMFVFQGITNPPERFPDPQLNVKMPLELEGSHMEFPTLTQAKVIAAQRCPNSKKVIRSASTASTAEKVKGGQNLNLVLRDKETEKKRAKSMVATSSSSSSSSSAPTRNPIKRGMKRQRTGSATRPSGTGCSRKWNVRTRSSDPPRRNRSGPRRW